MICKCKNKMMKINEDIYYCECCGRLLDACSLDFPGDGWFERCITSSTTPQLYTGWLDCSKETLIKYKNKGTIKIVIYDIKDNEFYIGYYNSKEDIFVNHEYYYSSEIFDKNNIIWLPLCMDLIVDTLWLGEASLSSEDKELFIKIIFEGETFNPLYGLAGANCIDKLLEHFNISRK